MICQRDLKIYCDQNEVFCYIRFYIKLNRSTVLLYNIIKYLPLIFLGFILPPAAAATEEFYQNQQDDGEDDNYEKYDVKQKVLEPVEVVSVRLHVGVVRMEDPLQKTVTEREVQGALAQGGRSPFMS